MLNRSFHGVIYFFFCCEPSDSKSENETQSATTYAISLPNPRGQRWPNCRKSQPMGTTLRDLWGSWIEVSFRSSKYLLSPPFSGHQTKSFVRKTKALHVRSKSFNICLKWPVSAYFGEREQRRLIFGYCLFLLNGVIISALIWESF